MKKLLYSILALAGVVATSCTQEHIEVVYNPENVTPAELVYVKAGDIASGVATEVTYTNVNYNMSVSAPVYTLYVAKSGTDMAEKQKLSADFSKATDNEDGTFSLKIDATTINNLLTKKLKAEFDQEISVDFQIETAVSNEKGTAVAGSEIYSNIVTVSYTPVAIKEALPDADEFDKVWVIGDYCGWAHDKTQFLFDYTASGNVYSGVVDFGAKAANGFKLTGVAGWDDTCNWGCDENNMPTEQEPASIQLVSSGGSKDIKAYAKRYYKFSFDKTSLILTKEFGFDSVGVIGVGGNWDTDAAKMEFNPVYCRFYADVTFAAGDEFKCRADGAWDLNWGANAVAGGDNVKVADAGNYRVYLNLNKGTLELNADMYGKQEPGVGGTTPEPEPEPGIEENRWGVVGTINSWGGTPDLYMNEVGENLYVRMGVTVTADDQFKVRFNNGWDINYGAAGEVEPFAVTVGEEMTLTAGGKNLSAPAGTYDIYFNIVDFKMWVMPEGETPDGVEVKTLKIYGDVSATGWTNCNAWIWDAAGANYTGGNWPGQALATETVDGKEYYVFDITEMMGKTVNVIFNNGSGEGSEQTVDITGVALNDDVIITLTEKGGDGKWLATVNGEAPVTPEPPAVTTYGLIGEFNGWGDDVDLVARGDGWYVTEGLSVTAGKLLIRLNDAWDEKFGNDGSTLVLGENTLTYGGADMLIEAGTFDFYFNPSSSKLFLVNAGDEDPTAGLGSSISYGLVGTINSWGGSPDIQFEAIGDGGYKLLGYTLAATEQIKIRANNEWNDAENYGLASAGVLTTNAANTLICGGASANMSVAADGTYDFYFYPAELTLYVMEAGQVPAR